MNRIWGKALVVAGLILMLGGAPSWGQVPNDINSDVNGNTAGGTNALGSNTTGSNNTAFGDGALDNNTTGDGNSAYGSGAFGNHTTGSSFSCTQVLLRHPYAGAKSLGYFYTPPPPTYFEPHVLAP